jgi:hypothetical protein
MINVVKKRGRPPGALNKKTRAVLAQAAMEGITPLQVRLKNMRRWDKLSIALERRAMALFKRSPEESSAMLERAEDFRERSLEFATAALPFVHRRLARVRYPVKVLSTVERVPDGMAGEARSKDGFKDFGVVRTTFFRQVDQPDQRSAKPLMTKGLAD